VGAGAPVGVGVWVVGVGVGLVDGDGVGDGLVDPGDGDGDGDGLADPGDGELTYAGGDDTLPLGVLLGLGDVAFPWDAGDVPESTGAALPLVLPGLPVWLGGLVPEGLPLVSPIVCWIPPRAKTAATTRTTAPATARAGRNQVIAGPTEPRRGSPALRGRFAAAQATRPPRTGSDRSRPTSPAAASSASAPAAEPDRTVLYQD
jgi:hypothetical protein